MFGMKVFGEIFCEKYKGYYYGLFCSEVLDNLWGEEIGNDSFYVDIRERKYVDIVFNMKGVLEFL